MDFEKQADDVARHLGATLKTAREANGLTVADIADKLHLKQSFVHALESGDYHVIGSMVYVKGYLRIYLRLLQLNADADIALLKPEVVLADKAKSTYAEVLNGRDKVAKAPRPYGKRRWLSKKVLIRFILVWIVVGLFYSIVKYTHSTKAVTAPGYITQVTPDVTQQSLHLPPSTLAMNPTVQSTPSVAILPTPEVTVSPHVAVGNPH